MPKDCNSCECLDGVLRCTGIDCGVPNCLNRTQAGSCPTGAKCVPKAAAECLSPPCGRWGECQGGSTAKIITGINEGACLPNSTYLNGDCAKIHIVFQVDKLPKVS